jgi:hydroxyacylglutathione hydrolase
MLPGTQPGSWEVDWIHGAPNCSSSDDPPLQVHAYNADTFIIRQSKCLNFEGPFIYLLFGEDAVFMQDTGATSSANQFPVRATVEGIIDDWLAARGRTRDSLELLVTHSHAHGDHVQGDGQFSGEPNTTVVGTGVSAVQSFFGFTDWPYEIVTLDLGGRVLEVTGIPGHHNTSVAVFDENAGLLLTGDTVYPGHLFVGNYAAFRTSINHLADMAATRTIHWVLGTHVEMSATPGVAYPYGTTYQPDEHTLQMPVEVLLTLAAALPANASCVPLDDVSVEPAGFGCN